MHRNPVVIKYVLVIGRNAELDSDERIRMFRLKSTPDIKVMTYDSIINHLNEYPVHNKVLAQKVVNGFRILNLNDTDTSLLAHLSHNSVFFAEGIREKFVERGYNIDAWEGGKLLELNDKEPMSKFKL